MRDVILSVQCVQREHVLAIPAAGIFVFSLAVDLSKWILVVFLSLPYLLVLLDGSILAGQPRVLGMAPRVASFEHNCGETGDGHWDGYQELG